MRESTGVRLVIYLDLCCTNLTVAKLWTVVGKLFGRVLRKYQIASKTQSLDEIQAASVLSSTHEGKIGLL